MGENTGRGVENTVESVKDWTGFPLERVIEDNNLRRADLSGRGTPLGFYKGKVNIPHFYHKGYGKMPPFVIY